MGLPEPIIELVRNQMCQNDMVYRDCDPGRWDAESQQADTERSAEALRSLLMLAMTSKQLKKVVLDDDDFWRSLAEERGQRGLYDQTVAASNARVVVVGRLLRERFRVRRAAGPAVNILADGEWSFDRLPVVRRGLLLLIAGPVWLAWLLVTKGFPLLLCKGFVAIRRVLQSVLQLSYHTLELTVSYTREVGSLVWWRVLKPPLTMVTTVVRDSLQALKELTKMVHNSVLVPVRNGASVVCNRLREAAVQTSTAVWRRAVLPVRGCIVWCGRTGWQGLFLPLLDAARHVAGRVWRCVIRPSVVFSGRRGLEAASVGGLLFAGVVPWNTIPALKANLGALRESMRGSWQDLDPTDDGSVLELILCREGALPRTAGQWARDGLLNLPLEVFALCGSLLAPWTMPQTLQELFAVRGRPGGRQRRGRLRMRLRVGLSAWWVDLVIPVCCRVWQGLVWLYHAVASPLIGAVAAVRCAIMRFIDCALLCGYTYLCLPIIGAASYLGSLTARSARYLWGMAMVPLWSTFSVVSAAYGRVQGAVVQTIRSVGGCIMQQTRATFGDIQAMAAHFAKQARQLRDRLKGELFAVYHMLQETTAWLKRSSPL